MIEFCALYGHSDSRSSAPAITSRSHELNLTEPLPVDVAGTSNNQSFRVADGADPERHRARRLYSRLPSGLSASLDLLHPAPAREIFTDEQLQPRPYVDVELTFGEN
jgi:hypothetical protein